jgi:hypothetical protein
MHNTSSFSTDRPRDPEEVPEDKGEGGLVRREEDTNVKREEDVKGHTEQDINKKDKT